MALFTTRYRRLNAFLFNRNHVWFLIYRSATHRLTEAHT
jgi:hypothetical protein